jgi:hypothetical protein
MFNDCQHSGLLGCDSVGPGVAGSSPGTKLLMDFEDEGTAIFRNVAYF